VSPDELQTTAMSNLDSDADQVEDAHQLDQAAQLAAEVKRCGRYRGKLVLRLPWCPGGRSFSLVAIFLAPAEHDPRTIQHEYGHTQQLHQLGLLRYLLGIGWPSARSQLSGPAYFQQPWEVTADYFGGVWRQPAASQIGDDSADHRPAEEALQAGLAYLKYLKTARLRAVWTASRGHWRPSADQR